MNTDLDAQPALLLFIGKQCRYKSEKRQYRRTLLL